MRVLYKAVASVSMIVLSAAVAFGIRHLRRYRNRRAEANASDVSQAESHDDPTPDTVEVDKDNDSAPHESDAEAADTADDADHDSVSDDDQASCGEVVEADTPVKSDVIEDQD